MVTKLFSHPGKVLIKEHLAQVADLMNENLKRLDFELFPIPIKIVKVMSRIIAYFHDFGKCSSYFQDYLNKKIQSPYSHHSPISAFIGAQMMGWVLIQFDEFYPRYLEQGVNLKLIKLEILTVIVFLSIRRHHSNLQDLMLELNDEIAVQHHEAEKIVIIVQNLLEPKKLTEITELYANLLLNNQDPKNNSIFQKLIHEQSLLKKIFKQFLKNIDSIPKIMQYLKKLRLIGKKYKQDLLMSIKNTPDFQLFGYTFLNFMFSSLIDSDKIIASNVQEKIRIRKKIGPDVVDDYKKIKFGNNPPSSFNLFREKFYHECLNSLTTLTDQDILSQRIFSLTAPTGIGKTYTVLSFALKLRSRLASLTTNTIPNPPRIIYCLPFTSIIDQNYQEIETILKTTIPDFRKNQHNYLLKVHHLTEILYKTKDEELPNDQALLLIESWNSEIIVTTFYQIFYSLFGFRNKQLKKFNKLANTILIFDEIQAFPLQYWSSLRYILLSLCKFFNLRVIFLSATQPAIMKENEIFEINPNINSYFNSKFLNRINFSYNFLEYYMESALQRMKTNQLSYKSIIFVANTIKTSLNIVKFILDEFQMCVPINEIEVKIEQEIGVSWNDKLPNENIKAKLLTILSQYSKYYILVYLSGTIIPHHRKSRIKLIALINELNNPVITVTTQLIEAGVDIDSEIIIRDFAPLDSLIQVSGRCNRNALNTTKRGEVQIYHWKNAADKNIAFCNYIYDQNLLTETLSVLKEQSEKLKLPWSENVFLSLSKTYFNKLKQRVAQNLNDNKIRILRDLKYSQVKSQTNYRKEISHIQDFEIISKDYKKRDIFIIHNQYAQKLFQMYCNYLNLLYKAQNRDFKELFKIKIDIKNQLRQIRKYFVGINNKDYEKIKDFLKQKANISFIPLNQIHNIYHPLYGINLT